MKTTTSRLAALPALIAALLLLPAAAGVADDRDLLVEDSANPYLFFLVDTSGSMNLGIGESVAKNKASAADKPYVAGFGDSPSSRLYASKEALFQIIEPLDNINLGLATFNQDRLRVPHRHWIYYTAQEPTTVNGAWPLDWPRPDADADLFKPSDSDGDGEDDILVDDAFDAGGEPTDLWTFGLAFDEVAGQNTCNSPFDLDDPNDDLDRRKANAFARTFSPASEAPNFLWVEEQNTTYLVLAEPAGAAGDPTIDVALTAVEVNSCLPAVDVDPESGIAMTLTMRLDADLNEFLYVDTLDDPEPKSNEFEFYPNLWEWTDVDMDPPITAQGENSCGNPGAFQGEGWEGNFDGEFAPGTTTPTTLPEAEDCFTEANASGDDSCDPGENLKFVTEAGPLPVTTDPESEGYTLYRGDILPLDWTNPNKTEFLRRLAPNWPEEATPRFGVSYHLRDSQQSGIHPSRIASQKPIIAAGNTPLGKSILDFRCYYMDDALGGSKCRNDRNFPGPGWFQVACDKDPRYGCRRPFFIMITDGVDSCPGENPSADLANLHTKLDVAIDVINVGDPAQCNDSNGTLRKLLQNTYTGGEVAEHCHNVADKAELFNTLQDLVGQLVPTSRTFASAAVPVQQSATDETIYLSNFKPWPGESVWEGQINAFRKPVPQIESGPDAGQPDTSVECSGPDDDGCLQWDAGAVMKGQVDSSDPLDLADAAKRRVFYSQLSEPGEWAGRSRLFDPVSGCDSGSAGSRPEVCTDLFDALEISYDESDDQSMLDAQASANDVISGTLAMKSHTEDGDEDGDGVSGETVEYILGDIFHSNPLVVGSPANTTFFALDLGADQDEDCDPAAATPNRGYRCFLEQQNTRRRTLVLGSNDGMLHAFDAGRFDPGDDSFTGGTGAEMFAYLPRPTLPTVKDLSRTSSHQFTVDGTLTVADAFVDPVHDSTGPDAGERTWRTVAVGGLRRGGRGYHALDLTQPDPIRELADGTFAPDDDGDAVPDCIESYSVGDCGAVRYGAALWEFEDRHLDAMTGTYVQLDEDDNGVADLGDTWSNPNIGRIRVCASGSSCDPATDALEDRYVAVFGGGMDRAHKEPGQAAATATGDWLYMVDIETGRPLYKRRLLVDDGDTLVSAGAAASEPAAVDTTGDGYLDRVYLGTLGGYMFRVDVGANADGELPGLTPQTVKDVDGTVYADAVERVNPSFWQPRVVFDTVDSTGQRRPIYHRPSVLFVAALGRQALAFGTGDREDLWQDHDRSERFFLFVDDTASGETPITEADLRDIGGRDAPFVSSDADFLLRPDTGNRRGWFLTFTDEERVVNESFSLSGVTVFSSFRPQTAITNEEGDDVVLTDEELCEPGSQADEEQIGNTCRQTGTSFVSVVDTTNANGLTFDTSGTQTRYREVEELVTSPFTEREAKPEVSDDDSAAERERKEQQLQIYEALLALFPEQCKFANYTIQIRTLSSDSQLQDIAPVPVCIIKKNWKEF